MVQVQGSAKVRLPDGRLLRLTYAGRNGQPYSSIGRILVEEGHIPAAEMSLANLKGWIRVHGQNRGEAGRALMQRNRSYVFFEASLARTTRGRSAAPASRSLRCGRSPSIATSGPMACRSGSMPKFPGRALPPSPFRRLLIAQDTGSAILGAARADLFFGSGDAAGHLRRRHPASRTHDRVAAESRGDEE